MRFSPACVQPRKHLFQRSNSNQNPSRRQRATDRSTIPTSGHMLTAMSSPSQNRTCGVTASGSSKQVSRSPAEPGSQLSGWVMCAEGSGKRPLSRRRRRLTLSLAPAPKRPQPDEPHLPVKAVQRPRVAAYAVIPVVPLELAREHLPLCDHWIVTVAATPLAYFLQS